MVVSTQETQEKTGQTSEPLNYQTEVVKHADEKPFSLSEGSFRMAAHLNQWLLSVHTHYF